MADVRLGLIVTEHHQAVMARADWIIYRARHGP
jgi:hypothetical protein